MNATQCSLFGDDDLSKHRPVALAPIDPEVTRLASALPRFIRLGTSSWSFPGWRGMIWDRSTSESTLARAGLGVYASHPLLRTVGIDKTFYRPPIERDLRQMAEQVPDDFRFLMKVPEVIVSKRPMHGEAQFLDVRFACEHVVDPFINGLGSKGGPLLFQFPPLGLRTLDTAKQMTDDIGAFLRQLPRGPLYAVEVRDAILLGTPWSDMLRSAGAVHCYNVHPTMPTPIEQMRQSPPEPSAPIVCRWMLHGTLTYDEAVTRYEPFDRMVDPDPVSRDAFAAILARASQQGRETFLIINNKAEGSAPLSIALLAKAILARGGTLRS
ncbi:MAG: DUF72 domain-containing protein [Planctomycetota bacterium]|nr:DUF72 domain-containing protein [Planctomycetota bacterium]